MAKAQSRPVRRTVGNAAPLVSAFSLPAEVSDTHASMTRRVSALLRCFECRGCVGRKVLDCMITKLDGFVRLAAPTGLIVDVGEYRVVIWHPRNDTHGRPRRTVPVTSLIETVDEMERTGSGEALVQQLAELEIIDGLG